MDAVMIPPLVELDGVTCGYGGRAVLRHVNLIVRGGEVLCLLGPNGIGKTTLFKTMLRLQPPLAGVVKVRGHDVARWSATRLATEMGYVPQAHSPPFPFSVLDVVTMGRAAHLGSFAQPSRRDVDLARAALDDMGVGTLAGRAYTEISGGERQLALVARALAQQPAVLVMDEPTSNLDFGNQTLVLERIRALAADKGMAVVLTTHDPNHALCYADRVACLERSGRLRVGTPAAMVTEDYLRLTYGVATRLVAVDERRRLCLPLGREEGGASCAVY